MPVLLFSPKKIVWAYFTLLLNKCLYYYDNNLNTDFSALKDPKKDVLILSIFNWIQQSNSATFVRFIALFEKILHAAVSFSS